MTKRQKFWKSAIALGLVIVLTIGLVAGALAYVASAARSDELQQQLDELQQQADENDELQQQVQDQLDSNYEQVSALVDQKTEIDLQIAGTKQQIADLNLQIEEYNTSIAAKQEELDACIAEQDELFERYKLRIRAMEENGEISYWSVLFNATSFSDLLDRLDMVSEVMTSDQLMLEQMEQVAAQIETERAGLEEEKAALEASKLELAGLEEQLEEQRAASDSYIQQISADLELLQALNLEYENRAADLEEEIGAVQVEYDEAKAAEEEEARRQQAAQEAAGSSTVTGGGAGNVEASGFLYPLPAGVSWVTDAFGYRWHPLKGKYSFHYGVDFAANQGTPIYATKSGTVSIVSYNGTDGNYVRINHGDGTESRYCHMDTVYVSSGEYVSQGQTIGTVGSTGLSTGPHMHFEIFVNGTNVNPMNYVSVQ